MAILVLKPREGSDAATDDDEVVPSAMDTRIEQRLVTPQRLAIAVGALLLVALSAYAYVEYGLTRTLTVGSKAPAESGTYVRAGGDSAIYLVSNALVQDLERLVTEPPRPPSPTPLPSPSPSPTP